MAKDKKLVVMGLGRESPSVVYLLAAYLDRNETVWVDDETIALAAFLLSNNIIPVKASRCRSTSDVAIRPVISPLEDLLESDDL